MCVVAGLVPLLPRFQVDSLQGLFAMGIFLSAGAIFSSLGTIRVTLVHRSARRPLPLLVNLSPLLVSVPVIIEWFFLPGSGA